MNRAMLIAAAAAALVGCQDATTEILEDGLHLDRTEGEISGRFVHEGNLVTFQSVALAGDASEVTVEVNGMILQALPSREAGVMLLDGFSAHDGQPTQVLEEDKALLEVLRVALEAELDEADALEDRLINAVNIWVDFPVSLDPVQMVLAPADQWYGDVCHLMSTWQYGSHDCWGREFWHPENTQIVYIGHYSWEDVEVWDFNQSRWVVMSPDHLEYPYEIGSCFGRCGAGCGSGTKYTWACLDHDGCVRNGHWIALSWCDDEFIPASWDYMWADHCGSHW